MRYTVKDFKNVGDQKLVGFLITDNQKNTFAIDKRIALVDGATNEWYVTQAFALCGDEIAEWQEQFAVIGKTFDAATNTLQREPVVEPEAAESE